MLLTCGSRLRGVGVTCSFVDGTLHARCANGSIFSRGRDMRARDPVLLLAGLSIPRRALHEEQSPVVARAIMYGHRAFGAQRRRSAGAAAADNRAVPSGSGHALPLGSSSVSEGAAGGRRLEVQPPALPTYLPTQPALRAQSPR